VIGPRALHRLVEARGAGLGRAAGVLQRCWRRRLARKQEAAAAAEGRLLGALAALVAELQVRGGSERERNIYLCIDTALKKRDRQLDRPRGQRRLCYFLARGVGVWAGSNHKFAHSLSARAS
jgi:hypothetical protein